MIRNWAISIAILALVGCGSTEFSDPDAPEPLALEVVSIGEKGRLGLPITAQLRNVTPDAVCLVGNLPAYEESEGGPLVPYYTGLLYTSVFYADGRPVLNPLDATFDPAWATEGDGSTVTRRWRIEGGEAIELETRVASVYLPAGEDLFLRLTYGDAVGVSGVHLKLTDCGFETRETEGRYHVIAPLIQIQ